MLYLRLMVMNPEIQKSRFSSRVKPVISKQPELTIFRKVIPQFLDDNEVQHLLDLAEEWASASEKCLTSQGPI